MFDRPFSKCTNNDSPPVVRGKIPDMSTGSWRVTAKIQRDTPAGNWPLASFTFQEFAGEYGTHLHGPAHTLNLNLGSFISLILKVRGKDKDQIRDLYASNLLVPSFAISRDNPWYNQDPAVGFTGPPIYIKAAECTNDLWSAINPNNSTMPTFNHLHGSIPPNPTIGINAYPTFNNVTGNFTQGYTYGFYGSQPLIWMDPTLYEYGDYYMY